MNTNSKTNRLKESASGSDIDKPGNDGKEPLVFRRTLDG